MMNFARYFVALGLLSLLVGCGRVSVVSSASSLPFEAAKGQSNAIPADIRSMEVENRYGTVRVVGVENEGFEWAWTLTVRAATDSLAQEASAEAACSAVREGDHFKVTVTLPDSNLKCAFNSELELRVPRSIALNLRNSHGRTEASNIRGNVEARSGHGAIEIRNVEGSVKALTSFGSLKVQDIGPARLENRHGSIAANNVNGELSGETSFGSLNVSEISGEVQLKNRHGQIDARAIDGDAQAETSFGSLTLTGVNGNARLENRHGSIKASEIKGVVTAATSFGSLEVEGIGPEFICRNEHGSIRLRARAEDLKKVDAETSHGSLHVRLPKASKPTIQAHTSFGEVKSDFPVFMKTGNAEVAAQLAMKAPTVSLENRHGSIRITGE